MKWLSSALCGPMNYMYRLLCMIKVLITVEIICLTPKEQIFHMSGLLAHYLQNWPRCFYTFRRQTEMESFIKPGMKKTFVKL